MTGTPPRIEMAFLPGADEPPISTPEMQKALGEVTGSLLRPGVTGRFSFRDGEAVPAINLGQVVVDLMPDIITAATALAGIWLKGRANRKVTLTSGGTTAEAATVEQVRELMAIARIHAERAEREKNSD